MLRVISNYPLDDPNTLTGAKKTAYDSLTPQMQAIEQDKYKRHVADDFEFSIRFFNASWGPQMLDPLDNSPFYQAAIDTLNNEFDAIRVKHGQTLAGKAKIAELVKPFGISRSAIILHGLRIESTIEQYQEQVKSKQMSAAKRTLLKKNIAKLIALRGEGNYLANKTAFENIVNVKPEVEIAVEAVAVEEQPFLHEVSDNCKNTIEFYKNESNNSEYPANYRAFLKSFIPRFEAIDMDEEPLKISAKLNALIKEIKSVPVPDLEENLENDDSYSSVRSDPQTPRSISVAQARLPKVRAEDPVDPDLPPAVHKRRQHKKQPAKSNYNKILLTVACIIVLCAAIATIVVLTGGLAALAALPAASAAGFIASAAGWTLALGKVGAIGMISLGLLTVTGLMTGIGALIHRCVKPAKKPEANDPAPSTDVKFHQFNARHPGRDVAKKPKVRSEKVVEVDPSQYESAVSEIRAIPMRRISR